MIAVVGGGPAGMTAAITAARICGGEKIILFEKKDRVGKKLLATGNGRCNLSNQDLDAVHFHTACPRFLDQVWKRADRPDPEVFWSSLGIDLVTLEEGKKYPLSLQASSVLDALRLEMERLGITVECDAPLQSITAGRKGYQLRFREYADPRRFEAVILACGGKASPQLGADGEGLALIRQLKLPFQPIRPALVRLQCESPYLKGLAGVRLMVDLTLLDAAGQELVQKYGELLFTADGLSGPPVLALSRDATAPGRECMIRVNLFPGQSTGQVFSMLFDRCSRFPYMSLTQMLNGVIHKRLIVPVCRQAGISPETSCSQLKKKQLSALMKALTAWDFPVISDGGWKEAQVTAGGADVSVIDPETMETLAYPGLFIAGEMLDVDGDCGGYNLYWAALSGMLAGSAAGSSEVRSERD